VTCIEFPVKSGVTQLIWLRQICQLVIISLSLAKFSFLSRVFLPINEYIFSLKLFTCFGKIVLRSFVRVLDARLLLMSSGSNGIGQVQVVLAIRRAPHCCVASCSR
jgi:hypothetical protein